MNFFWLNLRLRFTEVNKRDMEINYSGNNRKVKTCIKITNER